MPRNGRVRFGGPIHCGTAHGRTHGTANEGLAGTLRRRRTTKSNCMNLCGATSDSPTVAKTTHQRSTRSSQAIAIVEGCVCSVDLFCRSSYIYSYCIYHKIIITTKQSQFTEGCDDSATDDMTTTCRVCYAYQVPDTRYCTLPR